MASRNEHVIRLQSYYILLNVNGQTIAGLHDYLTMYDLIVVPSESRKLLPVGGGPGMVGDKHVSDDYAICL